MSSRHYQNILPGENYLYIQSLSPSGILSQIIYKPLIAAGLLL
jgi:hypothetical protein